VGIIGLIDDYTIQSISASRVADYAFLDEVETIRNYAYQLNVSEACDLVVVSLHGYYSSTNQEIADLAEEGEAYRIDALFNGHTHSNLASSVARVGTDLPFSQVSGKSTSLIGKITLVYDRISDEVLNFSVESVGSSVLSETDPFIDSLITSYSTNTDFVTFISEPLAYTPYRIGRDLALSTWGSSVIRDYAGVDFGMVNSGGFRVDMESGVITMGDLVEWYPFDNAIKTCEMTGAQLTNFYLKILNNSSYDVVFDDSVSFSGGVLFKNGSPVGLSDWYTVGAVDYIFDKTNYDFLNGRKHPNDRSSDAGSSRRRPPGNGREFQPRQRYQLPRSFLIYIKSPRAVGPEGIFLFEGIDVVSENLKLPIVIRKIIETAVEQVRSIGEVGKQFDQHGFDDMGVNHDQNLFIGIPIAQSLQSPEDPHFQIPILFHIGDLVGGYQTSIFFIDLFPIVVTEIAFGEV
jgi:2',3'-cyclic-nucleotide 2'-phosphodiesterase (5'-nucleotidase family)